MRTGSPAVRLRSLLDGHEHFLVAPRTPQTPGGSSESKTTEPATRGRSTAGTLLRSETGRSSSSTQQPARRRVSQGTRKPEVAGP